MTETVPALLQKVKLRNEGGLTRVLLQAVRDRIIRGSMFCQIPKSNASSITLAYSIYLRYVPLDSWYHNIYEIKYPSFLGVT